MNPKLPSKKDLIKHLETHFTLRQNPDGSISIDTSDGPFKLFKDEDCPKTGKSNSFDKMPEFNKKAGPSSPFGSDDINPDLENRIRSKHTIQGMIPDLETIRKKNKDDSSDENPFIKKDPTFPPFKGGNNFPDPDPDDYYPPRI